MEFYDILDQTKYSIQVSKPERVEDLSDLFISKDELEELVGRWTNIYAPNKPYRMTLDAVISSELKKYADKLDASGKKTLLIDDDDLLNVLKDSKSYVSNYIDASYCRHGNRIGYARRYVRKKTKPTKGDVQYFWVQIIPSAFRLKFGCYPSHIPTYDRGLLLFKAFKKILGWKNCSELMDAEHKKFFKMIWDNPEEYI